MDALLQAGLVCLYKQHLEQHVLAKQLSPRAILSCGRPRGAAGLSAWHLMQLRPSQSYCHLLRLPLERLKYRDLDLRPFLLDLRSNQP